MGFWSGFEGLTGHQPGAFKGFSLKDILDKDMWERRERLGGRQSRQFENTGVVPTTAVYKGMGKEGMFGDVVRPYGGGQSRMGVGRDRPFPITPRSQPRMAIGRDRPFPITPRQQPAQDQMFPYKRQDVQAVPIQAHIPGVSPTQGLDSIRHWGGGNPNTPGMMAADPTWAGGLRGAGLNAQVTPPPALDKTTVIKKSADPGVADTQTTTIKEKLDRAGLSLRTTNQGVVPSTPPGTTDIFSRGQWRPVDQAANWQPEAGAKAKPFWGLQDWYRDLARRRYEESMRARRGY